MEHQKHFLQKFAKAVGIICIALALGCGIYLIIIFNTDDKILKGSVGATTFFFFAMGFVLNTISNANLPNLKIGNDTEL